MFKIVDINKPESQNWLKQWRALYITRKALLPTVKAEAIQLHGDILHKAQVPACTTCSARDVQNRHARCPWHTIIRDELVKEHAYGHTNGISALTLRNTKTENWALSPWEIAKVFMPPSGYEVKDTIEETDFHGIACFIINCKRFKGKITGSICEKALEVVNHMPDIYSNAMNDQATAECIDILYALLNEPGLQIQPEAIQARKQLDELKTSKDENTYKYICLKLHAEFQQRLSDIDMKLETAEIDTERAKEYIHTESKHFQRNLEELWGALEQFSDDAMHDLTLTKDGILLSINKERTRVMRHMASLENTATEHIEQFILEGKRTLDKHLEEETRRATKHIEQCVTDGQRALEDQTEIQIQRLRTEEAEHLQTKKNELKEQLLNHYRKKVRMKVRLDIDAAVEDVYEKPKLLLKNKKDKDGQLISEMHNVFLGENGKRAKTVFVEGEAGTGKSSLCRKIVHDWCKLNVEGNKETRTDKLLSQIKFLFYIRLREVEDQCKIKEMILQCLIERIQSDDTGSNELLTEILKSEHCLLLLDGLDEWKHRPKCNRDERIPHVETSWINCTTLITTRPYKLAEVKVSLSQLGNHVQVQGVQSPRELVRRILEELGKSQQVAGDTDTCVYEIQMKGLWHFRKYPIMLVHIVWLWHKDKLKEKMHSVYKEIIDERWCEMCIKKHIEEKKPPNDFLSALGKLAFHKLFSASEDDSIVFEINGDELEDFRQYKQSSLESGIISCNNRAGERSASYQFLHKTLQEYLSAWHMANCGSELSKMCTYLQNVYLQNRNERVFSLSQVFWFLCELNKTAAEMFSKTLNELFTENCETDDYSSYKAEEFQKMILRGYDEAEKSGHFRTELKLCLQHVVLGKIDYFDEELDLKAKQKTTLKHCLKERKSNLVSLYIGENSDLSSAFKNETDSSVLDLAACKNLKFVCLTNVPYEDINQLHLCGVLECNISFRDYQAASKLISSFQSSDLTCLKTLTMDNFGFECRSEEIISKLKNIKHLDLTFRKASRPNDSQLDLGHLIHLDQLSLCGLDCSDVVNLQMAKLRTLVIGFRTQHRTPQLMAALQPQSDGSLTTAMDGSQSVIRNLTLANIRVSASVFLRLVRMVIKSENIENYSLEECTIENDIRQLNEEMGNQPALQVVPSTTAPPFYTTQIVFKKVTMSAGIFRRVVSMLIQSGHSEHCAFKECTIVEARGHRQEEIGNQPALQVMNLQPASHEFITQIELENVTVAARVFRCLVSLVIMSGHAVGCMLTECTIKEEMTQDEIVNQPLFQAAQPASSDLTKDIVLNKVKVSTRVFWRLVSMLMQCGHSVSCWLEECTLEEDLRQLTEENGKQQLAIQEVTQQSASPDYVSSISLEKMTVSAGVYWHLVSIGIQSEHSVSCLFKKCAIEEDMWLMQEEIGNQVWNQQPDSPDYETRILLEKMTVSARVFRRLVSVVIQTRHSVICGLTNCTIDDNMWHQEEGIGNQPALQVMNLQPASPDFTTKIELENVTVSAGMFWYLVSVVIRSRHSISCCLEECNIEEDMNQLQEMENQSALQMNNLHSAQPNYKTRIELNDVTVSAGVFRRLVTIVIHSGHSLECSLEECTIEEDMSQLQDDIVNQPALQNVIPQPASHNYKTHVDLTKVTLSEGVLRCLASMLIQSGLSVDCKLTACTIEDNMRPLQEMGNQPTLQMVIPQPVQPDYKTYIELNKVTMSARVFRRFVSMVIQSGHSMDCKLMDCTIEPDEEVRQLQMEMENLAAIQVNGFSRNIEGWCIEVNV